MAKIRHLAIATQDPDKLRHFYETAFGFETLRFHESERAVGYMMTDGAINIAVLKFKTDQLGKGIDYVGLHHIGIYTTEAEACVQRVLALGAEVYQDEMELTALADGRAKRPDKFRGMEGMVFDVCELPWPGTSSAD
ncbi:MAG: VOC family protein [Lautropia sp.]